jgi:plastocyanin
MPSRGSDRRVRFGRRRRLLGLPVGAVLAAAAIGVLAVAVAPGGVAADPDAQAAAAVKVSIGDNFFSPVKRRVDRLGKVRWTNNGQVEHNVTFKGGYGGYSRNVGPGESVVKKFNKVGKFSYYCTLHPPMSGKVRVLPHG